MIAFTCPCGQPFQARDEHAGQVTRCPRCGREQRIPDMEVALPVAALAPDLPAARVQSEPPAAAAREVEPPSPALRKWLVPGLIAGGLVLLLGLGLLWAALRSGKGRVSEAAARAQSANNLKQMFLALEEHNRATGRYPSAALCDATGKPLLSWRVALLPYLDQRDLYKRFKLNEPWDGPNNSKLLEEMPQCYAMPGDTTAPRGHTFYRVFYGKGAAFDLKTGFGHGAFSDGKLVTLFIVEAGESVPWTKPDELPFEPEKPLPRLGGHFSWGIQALMGDGRVVTIPANTPQAKLKGWINRQSGLLKDPPE
jgi:hypothetical protein